MVAMADTVDMADTAATDRRMALVISAGIGAMVGIVAATAVTVVTEEATEAAGISRF